MCNRDTVPDMRVLGRIRLSRISDESTSPERQREVIERWAKDNDHTIVGWAEDLDVSGSVDPFDTPALGPWLRLEKLGDWDILCAWKLDRISRRAIPMNKVFGWVMEHDKTLVCVAENLDLGTWMGRMIANVIAGVAEGELEAIRERTQASHQKLRELGRWPGGKPAYGYRAQQREDAAGWELVPDAEAAAVLKQIVGWVLDGQSVESIARTLTDAGELTPADYIRKRNGEPVRLGVWRGQTIRKLLRSKTLLGHVTHNGATVRDEQGAPVLKGPPLVSQSEFDQLQGAIEAKSFTTTRSLGASPMLGVAVCYQCDGVLYHRQQTMGGRLYRYYYCRHCRGSSIHADKVEELVEQTFLEAVGDSKKMEPVFVPGENNRIEFEAAVRAVDELLPLAGTATSPAMRERLQGQLRALNIRLTELENQPSTESRWEYRETGETYAEAWDQGTSEDRRQLLLQAGITAAFGPDRFELRVPHDLETRLTQKIPPK